MALTGEALVSYAGLHGMAGLAHVRVYDRSGCQPVVIAGQLADNPGPMLPFVVEMLAAVIHQTYFSDGREFQLITYEPTDLLGSSRFLRVQFAHRSLRDDPDHPSHYTGQVLTIDAAGQLHELSRGQAKPGDYRDPTWHPVKDIEALVGCRIQTWPKDQYTIGALFGADAEKLRDQLREHNHVIGDQVAESLESGQPLPND